MGSDSSWSLDIKKMSWTENTEKEVEFLIRTLALTGRERILDLACGFGRHSLAFAARGYEVVGVDLTPEFIADARKTAEERRYDATFVCADIREVAYREEFDVVLNLADGAIGYLENDAENLKVFDAVTRALKPGGKHFMDICNREHAERCFPRKGWEIGKQALSLADLRWDAVNRRMLYSGWFIPYGEVAERPVFDDPHPGIRLYSKNEISEIMKERGMHIVETFGDYGGAPDTYKKLQLMIFSRKNGR